VIIFDEIENSRLFKDETQKMYNSRGTVRNIMDLWEKALVSNKIPLFGIKNKVII
jgi:hypothetical protein